MWPIAFALLAVAITTGNVTVLVVFTRTSSLRKPKYFLLMSLAVADLLLGMISVPMYVTLLLARTTTIVRNIYSIQDVLFGTASVFGLTAVAIERAFAVYFPFKHRTLWKGVYIGSIAVLWGMAAFIAIFYIFFQSLMFYTPVGPIVVSLALIVISYFLIWIKINYMPSVQGHATNESDKRLTVTVLVVTVFSLIAWIPFQVLLAYSVFCEKGCEYNANIVYGTKFLHYNNSLVNPIIYALLMPQFKTALLYRLRNCLVCSSCHEEAYVNRANVSRVNVNINNRHHGNDVVIHVSYEGDDANIPNTNGISDSNNINDVHHDNDVVNDVSYD